MIEGARLEVAAATVSFAPDRPAVDAADLRLTCGRVTALLGPSGSGKSTLLRAIAGLETLESGEIRFGGQPWSGPGAHLPPEARRCGVVFQDYALFPHLTALDNVAFGLRGLSREARRNRARARLESVELGDRAGSYPHELSGGEQQRVALARALAPDPDVVLLDEPFSGLDRRLRRTLRDTTLNALRQAETASLIVTHDAEEAMAVADEIALMSAGRIIQSGPAEALYLAPVSETAGHLLGDLEVFETRVADGRAETPLGPVEAKGFSDGDSVKVLVRPEGVIVGRAADAGVLADIVERRPAGGSVWLVCRLENGRVVRALAPVTETARAGDAVRLRLDARFASVTKD
ncbi:ABC transporter ATP-binding protein [Marinicauda salina]|uniref:ABC transporter ATP-binding protein n=1 Tax=Marinicauda salina TaxID=2135793 RepID=A0A2U2BSU7_9PROT|nr:ABC transporter ATP-binding protein [Marinicauda salina]PWE17085.1 ABC transporter ATP-binding protein [Marinicauda salina]